MYKFCSIKTCNKKLIAKGFCPMHYARFMGYNKIELNAPHQKPNLGKGWLIDKDGYKQIRIGNKYVREHRFIMEQHLGRKLLKTEAIHHINGIKTDNKKENLEIISFSYHTIKHLSLPLKLKQQTLELYKQGIALTKIPKMLPIGYSCAYWFIRNSGEKIRGIHNRNLKLDKKI